MTSIGVIKGDTRSLGNGSYSSLIERVLCPTIALRAHKSHTLSKGDSKFRLQVGLEFRVYGVCLRRAEYLCADGPTSL